MTIISGDDNQKIISMDSYSTEEPASEHGNVILTEYAKKMMKKKCRIDISHSKAFHHLQNGTAEIIDFSGHGNF